MENKKENDYILFLKSRISPNVNPDIAEKMIQYALSPEEHELALNEIKDYCFFRKSPVSHPKIFLIIAQTGGGKSGLSSRVLKENPNTVLIESDIFKAFNPNREIISQKHPTLYGYLTGLDAYLHRDEIYDMALEKGYNVLLEIAPSTTEKFFNVDFEKLKNMGYKIEANVMAVSKSNSLLSIHERYEGQIEAGMNAPKLTDLKRALDSYESMEIILNDLLNMPDVDINLWKRGDNLFEKGRIFMPSPTFITNDKSLILPLFKEARRVDETLTLGHFEARLENIKYQMGLRNAPADQQEQLSQVEEIIRKIKID